MDGWANDITSKWRGLVTQQQKAAALAAQAKRAAAGSPKGKPKASQSATDLENAAPEAAAPAGKYEPALDQFDMTCASCLS